MADVLKKGESAMGSSSGVKAPRQLDGLNGPAPVLDNRWGKALSSVKQPNSFGKGKK